MEEYIKHIAVVGMGYVGMPIAVEFSRHNKVIGFDINREKIECYKSGIDPTCEIGDDTISKCNVEFTYEEARLSEAKFIIIAVPTPVNKDHSPNLTPVIEASRLVGRNMKRGSIVVYESTVYPGVTDDICLNILEEESGLKGGSDFKIGYSPERINPGDKIHTLKNIVKVVSGMDTETLNIIAEVYGNIIEAGIYKAESIKVAEAAKVIENSQRDINIAFMNELSIIFHKLGIDTQSVLKAAATKWNFLNFAPGLVGGHCIGVDPYYLTYKAEELGYHSQIILAGRRINDNMGKYIAENIVKNLIKADKYVKNAKVAILGITFKENCPDIRNSKVIDIINELKEYDICPCVSDPLADISETREQYGIELVPFEMLRDVDAVVVAVAHKEYLTLEKKQIAQLFGNGGSSSRVLIDVKGILNKNDYCDEYIYWNL